jgi:hypothetical protein
MRFGLSADLPRTDAGDPADDAARTRRAGCTNAAAARAAGTGSIRHDHVPRLTDSKSRSSSPALDPPRRRSCKYAFVTSTLPSIFLAYRRFPHLRPTNHAPQRRQPTHSSASVALTHLRRAQASIALGRSLRYRLPFPAGSFIEGFRTPATVQAASLRSAGIRNPQQQPTFELKEATN